MTATVRFLVKMAPLWLRKRIRGFGKDGWGISRWGY